jgi:hypothetical protein
VARKIFPFRRFVHKSLTINDLRRLGRRKPLIIKDLRIKIYLNLNLTLPPAWRIVLS